MRPLEDFAWVKGLNLVFLGLLVAVALPVARAQTNCFPPQLAAFVALKEQQESQLARRLHVSLPADVTAFFDSAHQNDTATLSTIVDRLGARLSAGYSSFTNGQPSWMPFWQPMTEVEGAYEIFSHEGTKYSLAFGEGIIRSIPQGSVYFGGTDEGRMLVTALCVSQPDGKPFYTLTQNALSDGRYVDYLRSMYGKEIKLPAPNDVQMAIDEYKSDALRRYKEGRLKQGEDVENGEVQLNRTAAVMGIHAFLVKWILNHNPGREFYYEESYPLELLYPYLTPYGLIFRLNHESLPALPAAEMDADHAFWSKQFGTMLGGWLQPDTSVSNLCSNIEVLYLEKNLSHFTGDKGFLTNDFAAKAFSKLRVSIAGLYQWRLMQGSESESSSRSNLEADYAFRQAYALCPASPEVVFRYVNFLVSQRRFNDATLVVHTTLKLTPMDDPFYNQYENLIMRVKLYREQAGGKGN